MPCICGQPRGVGDGARTHRSDSRRHRGPSGAERHRRRPAVDMPHLRQLRRRVRAPCAHRTHRQPRAPGVARAGRLSVGSVIRVAQRVATTGSAPGPARLRTVHATHRPARSRPPHRAAVVVRHARRHGRADRAATGTDRLPDARRPAGARATAPRHGGDAGLLPPESHGPGGDRGNHPGVARVRVSRRSPGARVQWHSRRARLAIATR